MHARTHLCVIRVVQLLILAVVPPTPRTVKAAETVVHLNLFAQDFAMRTCVPPLTAPTHACYKL